MKFLKILFVLLFWCGFAIAQKDTLIFTNGTVVIGEVEKIQLGVITFDPDDANDITVQLRKLNSIHAADHNYRIETVDHQVLFGKIYHSSQVGYVSILYGTDSSSVALNNISNLYPIEKNFWERITGSAGAGYSYTRSSELGRLNLDLNARYLSKEFEYSVYIATISTFDEGVFTRDNEDVGIGMNYYFHPTWFGRVLISYQRNIELGIESRFQQGLGMGNKLLLTRYVRLHALSGMVFNEETSTEGEFSGTLTEIMLGIQFNVFRFAKPEIDIQTTQYGFFSISQERIRYTGDLSVNWEMVEDLDLKLSFYVDYDSRLPGQESANSDFGTVISVAFEF